MVHYIPKDDDGTLAVAAKAHAFTGPVFVGQGLTYSVGSDSYGYFIVSIKQSSKKLPIVGICGAKSHFSVSWTEGSQTCELPDEDITKCKATKWITTSGKWKDGSPKWWYCDENGKKFNRQHARFGWNGAYAYQDPSF